MLQNLLQTAFIEACFAVKRRNSLHISIRLALLFERSRAGNSRGKSIEKGEKEEEENVAIGPRVLRSGSPLDPLL